MRKVLRLGAILLCLALAVVGGAIAHGLGEAAAVPLGRAVAVELPGLDPAAAPYRVALLSDIHFGNRAMGRERLDSIVEQVNAARPDLVVIAGDFVNGYGAEARDRSALADLAAALARLKARHGVVATLGNHEFWSGPDAVQAGLEAAGIHVPRNQPLARGPLLILGLDDRFSGHDDIGATTTAAKAMPGVRVAVSHSPDLVPDLPGEVRLVLAGHTHCGQIVLPLLGAPLNWSPHGERRVYNPRYRCGVIREGGRTIVVTAGLGSGTIPIRIGAPPDWWLVALSAPPRDPGKSPESSR